MPTYPFPTTTLAAAPGQSSFPTGTNLLVVTPDGLVGQTPLSLLPSSALFINVKTLGAVGNNVADDKTAIQAAVSTCYALGGGTVFLPPGTYYTSGTITIYEGVRLLGDGAKIVSHTPSQGAKLSIDASNVIIENITLDGGHTGSTGTPLFTYGLVQLVGGSAAPVKNVVIKGCHIQNSECIGIRIIGNCASVTLTQNVVSSCFIGVWAEKSSSYIFSNLAIRGNVFESNWYTSTYSGAIKLKGDGGAGVRPAGIIIEGNSITNCGEMGIELFDSCQNAVVAGNMVTGAKFSISLDSSKSVSIQNNQSRLSTYCGIEIANNCSDCIVSGNSVDGYDAAGDRASTHGIISSGPACYNYTISNNRVRGVAGAGIELQGNHDVVIGGNFINDCTLLVNPKDSSAITIERNTLQGPCNYHVFVDINDIDCSDIAIDHNWLSGDADFDNIIIYSGVAGRHLTNLRIVGNNAASATCANLPLNMQVPESQCPNMQVEGNYTIPGTGKAVFKNFTNKPEVVLPYFSGIQAAGMSVAAKRLIPVTANAAAQWIKVLDLNYGNPLLLNLHVLAETPFSASVQMRNAITAQIIGSPYGFDRGITLLPSGDYQGGIIEEVVYNNPLDIGGGAQQEVWLKIRPLESDATLEVHFSDYPEAAVINPAITTTAPTLAANSYRAQIEITPHALQSMGVVAREFIASAPKGSITSLGARMHIRGVGALGYPSDQRVARFDTDDGNEAVGVDLDGRLRVAKMLSVGGGPSITAIAMGEGTLAFGSVLANADGGYNVYVPGALVASKGSVSVGFSAELPSGIVLKQAFVTSNDNVRVVLRNMTGADISVGTIYARATVLQF